MGCVRGEEGERGGGAEEESAGDPHFFIKNSITEVIACDYEMDLHWQLLTL